MKQTLTLITALLLGIISCGAQEDALRFTAQPTAVVETHDAFACELSFDLSGFQGKSTAYADLVVPMNIQGSGYAKLNLFTKNDSGVEQVVAVTCPNAGHKAATFDLTDFINNQLPDRKLVLRLRQAAGSDVGLSFIKNRPVTLGVSTEEHPRYDLLEILTPVWSSKRMVNETIMPVSVQGNPAEARLLFTPSGKVTVRDYALDKTWQEGVDYNLVGNRIILTGKSGIPSVTEKQLYPDSPGGKFATTESCKGGTIAAQEGMSDYQLAVSYDHAQPWTGPVPADGAGKLAVIKKKLQTGQPIKIALLGDSISFGASASKSHPPYLPGWGQLLIRGLRNRFQSEITFVNPSRGGANSNWGVKVVPDFIIPEKPDLFIIAFGMNDANATSAESYIANIKKIMAVVSAENPETEFILVASMMRNENWRPMELMRGYLPALKNLESEHVAVADVWSVSEHILKTKRYCDISGNHINHPNDFMVRVYAQVTGALLKQ